MPQLVIVKESTAKDDRQPGHVIGIYPDNHKFTGKHDFNNAEVIKITEEKAQEFEAVFPKIQPVFKASTTEWTLTSPQRKEAWDNNGDWCEIKGRAFRHVRYENGDFVNTLAEIPDNKTVLISKSEKS